LGILANLPVLAFETSYGDYKLTARHSQCPHCGHLYNDASGFYYGEDFARYFNRREKFVLQWCYNCNHVIVLKPAKFLGFIPTNSLSVANKFRLEDSSRQSISQVEDSEIGGLAISHLLISIWWSFNCRAELSVPDENAESEALRQLVDRLPIRETAFCLYVVSRAHLTLPLEVQLERGKYLNEMRSPDTILEDFLKELEKHQTGKSDEVVSLVRQNLEYASAQT